MAHTVRRAIGWVFAFLVAVTVGVGCSADELSTAGADSQQKVTLVCQGVPEPEQTDPLAMVRRAALQAFLKANPDIDVEPFVMPEVTGSAAMDSGPLMAIAAGIPPQVIYVNFRQSSTYIEHGFLEPIDVLLARVRSPRPEVRQTDGAGRWVADPTPDEVQQAVALIRERVPELAWEVVNQNDGRRRHVWALPMNVRVAGLFYRKDLFQDAGLDPERPPRTWDEFLEYARRLTLPGRGRNGQYGTMLYSTPEAMSWSAYTYLVSNGARALKQDETGQWRAVYGSREAAEALYFIWRLVHEPFERNGEEITSGTVRFVTTWPEMRTRWLRGEIGMYFTTLDNEMLGEINPQLVGVAPVPASPRGTRGSELNCHMLGIFSDATPQQKLAAMRYIWFMTGDEAERIRTQAYVDNGYGLFVSPTLLEKYGYDRLLRRVPDEWKQVFSEALEHGVPEPYGRNTQNIYRHMSKPISEALELDLSGVPREDALTQIQALLKVSEKEINQKLLGRIPPEQMRIRRLVAAVAVVLVAAAFLFGGVWLWRYFSQAGGGATDVGGARRRWTAWLLLVPALLVTAGWLYVPLAGSLAIAFTDYRLVMDSTIVWLDNFATALFDAMFWASLGRTLYFVALIIALGFWPPILLAILLDEVPTAGLKYLFRTVYYLPAVITGVIIMFLWKQLFAPTENGPLNQAILLLNALGPVAATIVKLLVVALWVGATALLISLALRLAEASAWIRVLLGLGAVVMIGGMISFFLAEGHGLGTLAGPFQIEPLRWMQSPQLAMLCVVLPIVWSTAGPGCLLYLAALKTVPQELYEAADIDGAGVWQKIGYITLPRLKFLIGIQFIAAVVGAFKGGTDYILAMTGGGPQDATMVVSLQIFIRTFLDLEFGVGAAMAWLLGLLLIGFTAYQLKVLSRAEFTAAASREGN